MPARKTQVEGAKSHAALVQGSEAERTKAKAADPAPGDNGAALARIVAFFKAEHPDEWEALRLGPCHHGIDQMIEKLSD